MEEINKIEIYKKAHELTIRVYPSFVLVMVNMPTIEFAQYIEFGIAAEQKALFRLLTSVFDEDFPPQKIFFSDDEILEYLENKGLIISKLSPSGCYFKNLVFEIETSNFEKSLDSILAHIRKKSEDFEKSKNPNKEGIVNNLFNKYFGER